MQLNPNVKERDATKIKYIINKINNIKNYYHANNKKGLILFNYDLFHKVWHIAYLKAAKVITLLIFRQY